ncbi:MAG: efflux RND transporter periplasmic adaptor subunit [Eubacteriales bacterium]|nr:efflux RND transporter periplasmic adaptor subunit [Eubacteriales bacterium]
MKKAKKKILIGVGVLAVVLGGVVVVGKPGTPEVQIPQVQVLNAEIGDVEQMVDASGTVVSDEQKTFFSPVNAGIKMLSFEQGDSVTKGAKLVEFDLKNLEKDNQKAELNVKSGKYDYNNSMKKSNKAEKKQKDAKTSVKELEQKIKEQKDYVASLKSQLSSVNAQAQRDAQAQAQAEAERAQAEAQAQAEAARKAEEEKNKEIQRLYYDALTTYKNETLPQYQKELGLRSATSNQALSEYNQAETAYQMAFSNWELDPSEENAQALEAADQARSNAQIAYQQANEQYEEWKAQPPQMPLMSDFMNQGLQDDLWTDGEGESDLTDAPSVDASQGTSQSSGSSSYAAPNTSSIENALEQASSDLAELQSELASQKAVAESDPLSLTKEEKEKLRITNNLTELDAKSAEELVEEGKKGISAEFNGVISKVDVVEGASVTQGMELFTLQNTEEVSVDINVSKYDYDKVKEGQKAEITLADRKYSGTVTKVSHIAVPNEKGTPLISAEIHIENPDENIFLGVDAKVKIHAATAAGVLTLPVEVVNIGKEGSFCYVLENGVVARRDITTGISSENYVEVKEGLSEGDQVIVDLGILEEGMPAQAASETGVVANE